MSDIYDKALEVWQKGQVIKDDYHSSTGLISNSFIKAFKKCEFGAVIEYARVEPSDTEFNQNYAIGHLVEAQVFEDEAGFQKMVNRYKDNIYQKNGNLYKWAEDCRLYAESILRHDTIKRLLRSESSVYHKTVIFDLYGLKCKMEADYFNENKQIEVDLKTTAKSFSERSWNPAMNSKDKIGGLTFIDEHDYHQQRAFYQVGIESVYGFKPTPHILAVSKKNMSVRMFGFDDQVRLDRRIQLLKPVFEKIKEVISGEQEPEKCEECPKCVANEKITGVIAVSQYCPEIIPEDEY